MFTLKRDLDNLQEQDKVTSSACGRRSNISVKAVILPKKCIFCDKVNKLIAATKSWEKLVTCQTFVVDDKIRESATVKDDKKVLAHVSDELIAKESVYHTSCYRRCTITLYNSKREKKDETNMTECTFETVKEYLVNLYETPDLIEYVKVTEVVEKNSDS